MVLQIGVDPLAVAQFFHQGDRIYPCFKSDGRIWFWRPARSLHRIDSLSLRFASSTWNVKEFDDIDIKGTANDVVAAAFNQALQRLTTLEFYP